MKKIRNKMVFCLTVVFVLNLLLSANMPTKAMSLSRNAANTASSSLISDQMLSSMGIIIEKPKIALDAISSGMKPGAFGKVNYELKPNVELLDEITIQAIKVNTKSGVVDISKLGSFQPDSGKIFIDKTSGIAFQFAKGEDQKTYLYQVDNSNLLQDIDIPAQNIQMNRANLSSINKNVTVNVIKAQSTGENNSEKLIVNFDESKTYTGVDSDGLKVDVKLKGKLVVSEPSLDVKYTQNDGYSFIFNAYQSAEASATVFAQMKKEIKIPILGFNVSADVCSLGVGVFVVINMDGEVSLDYSMNERIDVSAGIEGGTWYYLPTGVDSVVLKKEFEFDTDNLSISAKIKGEIYVAAQVDFKLLGYIQLGAAIKIGLALSAEYQNGGDSDGLTISADLVVLITGKIKIKSFDKNVTIFDYKYPLFKRTQKAMATYFVTVEKACAYENTINVLVEKLSGAETKEAWGKLEIVIRVAGRNGTKEMKCVTGDDGKCKLPYNLIQGSTIQVNIPSTGRQWSEPVKAMFPFSNVVIDKADYYEGTVTGYVSPDPKGLMTYSGPMNINVVQKENIPIVHSERLTIPISHINTIRVNCVNGKFIISKLDMKPYDKVYASVDYDGFKVNSSMVEAEGLDFIADGNYVQEPARLYSKGGSIILSGSYIKQNLSGVKGNLANSMASAVDSKILPNTILPGILNGYARIEPKGEIIYQVYVQYPHGSVSKSEKVLETKLPLRKNAAGVFSAEIAPWEAKLDPANNPIVDNKSQLYQYLLASKGQGMVLYHVYETIVYVYKGKRMESTNEALKCDFENANNGIKLPVSLGIKPFGILMDDINMNNLVFEFLNAKINPGMELEGILNNTGTEIGSEEVQNKIKAQSGEIQNSAGSSEGLSNFSCNVLVKKYSSKQSKIIESTKMNLMVLGNMTKITSGSHSTIVFRDLKRKVLINNELGTASIARYDGDDFILALGGLKYSASKQVKLNKTLSNLYIKSGSGTKLTIYEGKGVPLKVMLSTGTTIIEMTFSNYLFNRVSLKDIRVPTRLLQ